MKYRTILLMAFLSIIFCFSLRAQTEKLIWSEELRINQLNQRTDSSTWDIPRMIQDHQEGTGPFGNPGRIKFGAFPVPHYHLLGEGSFKGLTNLTTAFQPVQVKDKQVVYTSFFVNDSPFYPSKNKKDKAFFTIVTVTDTIDLQQYTTHRLQVVSRNHPDYIGQGFIKTKQSAVDFIAFITPEGNNYAIINMRLFDLNHGNIIVIAPHKDGSFRSMQLKEKEFSFDTIQEFMQSDLLKRSQIIEFLTNNKVI